jgi:NAD(P)-dependent dehydrogenase (short-subunit alcohol dehydrogenase family)
MSDSRLFAIVTGASTGFGFELAKRCAKEGYDLLIAADEPEIERAAASLLEGGTQVEALQADLATTEGVDKLYAAAKGRQVDALLANAGRGLGHAFLDQDFEKARRVVDTNITGTVYLIHKVGNDMRRRNSGRIMIVGFHRRLHARQFSGRLQWYQGLPEFVLFRAARGIKIHQSDGDLPHARRHRDGILPSGGDAGYRCWNRG